VTASDVGKKTELRWKDSSQLSAARESGLRARRAGKEERNWTQYVGRTTVEEGEEEEEERGSERETE
jgi:hypothetical protein